MKTKTKLTIMFLIIAILPMILLALITINYNTNLLEEQIKMHILTTAQDRARNVETLLDDKALITEIISTRTVLRERFNEYLNSPDENKQNVLNSMLNDSKGSISNIDSISLVDREGKIVASTDNNLIGKIGYNMDLFQNGVPTSNIYFEQNQFGDVDFITSSPMTYNGSVIGTVLIHNNVEQLTAIARDRSGFGNTTEVLMATLYYGKRIYLYDRLFETDAIPDDNQTADTALPMKLALNKTDNIVMEGLDYRGVDVIAAIEYVPQAGIGLVVKIDKTEVQQPINDMRTIVIIVFVITTVVLIIISVNVANGIVHPMKKLTTTIESISKGEIETHIDKELINSNDEIGDLARSMERVLVSLKLAILRVGLSKEQIGLGEAIAAKEEAETFLESVIENIPNMIFVKDAKELRFKLMNNAGEKLLGVGKEDMIGKNDYDFFPKKQAEFFINKDREVLNSKKLLDIPEEEIDTKDGKKYLHTKKIPVLNKDGNPKFLLGISEDITDIKKNEEMIRENERRYRLLFDTAQDAIMTLEPPLWKFTTCNPATIKLFGVESEKEFVSADPWELSPEYQPDGKLSSKKAKMMIEQAMKNGSSLFKWVHKKKDGTLFHATVLLSRMTVGNKTFLQATVRDESSMRKAEEGLELYKKGFENSTNSMVLVKYVNSEPRIETVNHSFTRIYGYTEKEANGNNPRVLRSGKQGKQFYKKMWSDLLNPEIGHWSGKIVNKRKDGSLVPVILTIDTIFNENGKPERFLAQHTDLSIIKNEKI